MLLLAYHVLDLAGVFRAIRRHLQSENLRSKVTLAGAWRGSGERHPANRRRLRAASPNHSVLCGRIEVPSASTRHQRLPRLSKR